MKDLAAAGLGLDLHGPVRLSRTTEAWLAAGAALRDRVQTSLAGVAVAVEVIGSASVPALLAKPIIDLDVGVRPGLPVSVVAERLEPEGWIYRSDQGDAGGQVFVLETRLWHRVAHLHVVEHDGCQWRDYLRLRDTLRTSARARTRYEATKLRLVDHDPANRQDYTLGKADVIASLLRVDPTPTLTPTPTPRSLRRGRPNRFTLSSTTGHG